MILALTQARLSSSRLPQKVLKTLGRNTVLGLHLKRLKESKLIDHLMLATTHEEGNEKLIKIASENNVESFQGSLNDVLDRFYQAAKIQKPDVIVRLTSDCPLVDAILVDQLIEAFSQSGVDYASNCFDPTFPDGFDAEVFTFKALERAWKDASLNSDREHVTPYIWRNSNLVGGTIFKGLSFKNNEDLSRFRLTLDNSEDYLLLSQLVDKFGDDKDWKTYTEILISNPNLFTINSHIERNAGYVKSIKEEK
jgi:spore coat polysaccharide biosynthesis protein SpsF (cytidylyltransferase family)